MKFFRFPTGRNSGESFSQIPCRSFVNEPRLGFRNRFRFLHDFRFPSSIARIQRRADSGDEEAAVTSYAHNRPLSLGDGWVVHLPHATSAALGAVYFLEGPRFGHTEEIELNT
jgi:hypothetical protein